MDYNTFILSELNKKVYQQTEEIDKQFQNFLNSLLNLNLPLETCQQIYKKVLSLRQSNISVKGKIFEDVVENILKTNKINYRSQTYIKIIDNEVYVSKTQTNIKVDFIVNLNSECIENQNIKNLIILSCKYTCRERYKQDNWTLKYQPLKYYLLIGSDDYPRKFVNIDKRKLILLKEDYENNFNF